MTTIYTIGEGKRTQFAKREDGIWFIRTAWRKGWTAWREFGKRCPYDFGKYQAPGAGKARLPNVSIQSKPEMDI